MPQPRILDRMEDTATQILGCNQTITQSGVEDMVLGLEKGEKSHTLTTTTTAFKNSQKEVNNQIDNQNQCSVPSKVSSLQAFGPV